MFLNLFQHRPDLRFACDAGQHRPAERIEKIRAGNTLVCAEPVPARAEIGIAALTFAAHQCACKEVALPAMRLNPLRQRGGQLAHLGFQRRVPAKSRHDGELVICDFEQKRVHHAFRIGISERRAIALPCFLELRKIPLLLLGTVDPIVVEL